ncbi:MAG: hypothetical protein L3J23_03770 [Flavobacteriaceae bacterium]|nr:hypothetical protein [Flavobacteriaceae bacterium]
MKTAKQNLRLIVILLITAFTFTSCIVIEDDFIDINSISLNQLLQTKDLWYIDYNATEGTGDNRFLSLAFTLSFRNGNLFANNNLVGLGNVGNGYGDQIGYYNTNGIILEIEHDLDGFIDLEVIQIASNRIKLRDNYNHVTYSLIGYNVNQFDYDQVFYDNIEYFLQEYIAWKKTGTFNGVENDFDNENFLAYIPEDRNSFQSSQDNLDTSIVDLLWDFRGEYEVFDVQGTANLKILTLDYDSYGNEEFELTVTDDRSISLYHNSSDTTYEFTGRGLIIYKNDSTNPIQRKRFKVNRKVKVKKEHLTKTSNRK